MDLIATIKMGKCPDDCKIQFGSNPDNPSWSEYLDAYLPKWQPHIIAIRRAIESSPFMRATADQFCNDYYFELSDGTSWAFTWQAWGDLMQAIEKDI
jgi:hypothetical protein